MACARLAIDRCDAILTNAAVLLGCALCANKSYLYSFFVKSGFINILLFPAIIIIIRDLEDGDEQWDPWGSKRYACV